MTLITRGFVARRLWPAVEGAVRYRASDVEDYAANLAARPMRERVEIKTAVGAAGRAGAPGSLHPGHHTEHHEGAA